MVFTIYGRGGHLGHATKILSGGFRGGSGGSLEPPSGTKLFRFHGENYGKSGRMLKTNPLFMDLNPPSRNPGSAPDPANKL